ncbi:unnamed protein product [Ectocarpus fasciculatus]
MHSGGQRSMRWIRSIIRQNYGTFYRIVVALVISVFVLNILHEWTHVWQYTVGSSLSTRTTCALNISAGEPLQLASTPKIAIVSMYGGDWPPEVMRRVVHNKEFYAKYHGYTMIDGNKYVDDTRGVSWFKLLAVEEALHSFDYVMYIDADAVIMDPKRPLDTFLIAGRGKDMIMTEDWSGLNGGVWIAKKSPWTHSFMKELWNQTHLIPRYSPDGKTRHIFEWEQRAFHYLIQSEMWVRRGMPKYDGDYMAVRDHIAYLPQCSFNSYPMHPMDERGGRDLHQYIDGDFIIHFAGKKGAIKFNLMEHYLAITEQRERELTDLRSA